MCYMGVGGAGMGDWVPMGNGKYKGNANSANARRIEAADACMHYCLALLFVPLPGVCRPPPPRYCGYPGSRAVNALQLCCTLCWSDRRGWLLSPTSRIYRLRRGWCLSRSPTATLTCRTLMW